MLRLLKTWDYVNGENLSAEPNTQSFLLGSPANWSLIAQGRRFVRDVEEDIWTWVTDFATDPFAKSTVIAVTGPPGYGIYDCPNSDSAAYSPGKKRPCLPPQGRGGHSSWRRRLCGYPLPDFPCYFFVDQASEHVAEVQTALAQQRRTTTNSLFVCGERRNEWLSSKIALGEIKELDRPYQFQIVKRKHEQELLVAMREAAAGDKVGFDSIIDSEYRGIDGGTPDSMARELYLLVCCFYQHGILIRDSLLVDVLGHPLTELYATVGDSLSGLVDYYEINTIRGEYAARARHRVIAQIVWKKCGTPEKKEFLLQRAMEKLNLTFKLDKAVFELFIISSDIINTFRTLEGKCKFFERAEKRDRNNPYVLQHYARMLLSEGRLPLAMSQIERAIEKDKQKTLRILYHTRAMILAAHTTKMETQRKQPKHWNQLSRRISELCALTSSTYGQCLISANPSRSARLLFHNVA